MYGQRIPTYMYHIHTHASIHRYGNVLFNAGLTSAHLNSIALCRLFRLLPGTNLFSPRDGNCLHLDLCSSSFNHLLQVNLTTDTILLLLYTLIWSSAHDSSSSLWETLGYADSFSSSCLSIYSEIQGLSFQTMCGGLMWLFSRPAGSALQGIERGKV